MSKPDVNVAQNKADNDAFSVYDDVDVQALQDEAIKQSSACDAAGRKETQMQVANILARYQQNKLIMDANPAKLYTVRKDGTHEFQIKICKTIARVVYDCPEVDADRNKQPLPQHLLARVRRIAPLVFYAIQERIPLVWCNKRKALAVPRWMTVSDDALLEPFWNEPEKRTGYNDPVYLDGKSGRTLDAIIKRVVKHQTPAQRNTGQSTTPAQEQRNKLNAAMANHGLDKCLDQLAHMFMAAPQDKPFSDPIVELLAVCCEHVNVRNGKGVLGAAIAEMSSEKPAPKRSAA